jgi:hypothetical protein
LNRRAVTFTPQARNDLLSIGDWIAERASVEVALVYRARLEAYATNSQVNAVNAATICVPACVLSDSNDGSQSCLPFRTTK